MDGLNRIAYPVLGLSALWLGCALPGNTTNMVQAPADAQLSPVLIEHPPPSQVAASAVPRMPGNPAVAQPPAWEGHPSTPPFSPWPPTAESAASYDLHNVLAELESLGALDAAAKSRLMQDLQNADPTLRPIIVQRLRTSLAHQQQAGRGPWTGPPVGAPPELAVMPMPGAAPQSQVPWPLPAHRGVAPSSTAGPPAGPRYFPGQPFVAAQPAAAQHVAAQPVAAQHAAAQPAAGSPQPPDAAGEVRHVSFHTEQPFDDWTGPLTGAIAALEKANRQPPRNAAEVGRHVHLRMLYLAAGRNEDALRPIPGIAPSQQDFWSQQLFGLATYLDTRRISDSSQRAAEARNHLNQAMARLAEQGTLVVRNLTFCTKVTSYGIYSPFKDYEFKPGQPLLLYAEVENFKSNQTPKGFHTALRSSYQILDSQGHRVEEQDLALTEEYCQNPRRDYFIRYFLSVPQRIYDGKYTLQLTIEDTLSQKIGQSTIEFTVREK